MDTLGTNITATQLTNWEQLNVDIYSAFERHLAEDNFRKTHLFNGRYENLYLDREEISEIEPILQQALHTASKQFSIPEQELKIGFWFNRMAPGEETTWHSHDDDDEILSGVYYVRTTEDSGNLIIENNGSKLSVTPVNGRMVCFPPSKPHSVEVNKSQQVRLSLAFNIGHDSDDVNEDG